MAVLKRKDGTSPSINFCLKVCYWLSQYISVCFIYLVIYDIIRRAKNRLILRKLRI